jgi:hypothetical protein
MKAGYWEQVVGASVLNGTVCLTIEAFDPTAGLFARLMSRKNAAVKELQIISKTKFLNLIISCNYTTCEWQNSFNCSIQSVNHVFWALSDLSLVSVV